MQRFIPARFKRLFLKILKSHDTPAEVADGLALGVFIAFLPIMGIQMYAAFAVAELFRKNVLAAILAVWVTNPLTAVPIYLFNLWVGKFIYNKPVSFSELFLDIRMLEITELLKTGKDLLIPLLIGSMIVGIIAAFVSQWLCLKYYQTLREKFHHLFHHEHHGA